MSGFAFLAVFTLLFMVFLTSDIEQFIAEGEYDATTQSTRLMEYDRISDYRHVNITITRVEYSSGIGTVYVENTGGVVLDPNYVQFILDDEWFSEEGANLSMSNEWWKPGEELSIRFSKNVKGGYHEVKVVAGKGVYAILSFYLPLVPVALTAYYDQWAPEIPRYRAWNGSAWSNERATANVSAVNNEIWWFVLKASRSRNELLLGTIDRSGHVDFQVWQNGSWGSPLRATTLSVGNKYNEYRGFDISYEQQSGRALVVYQDNSATPKYRIWNGSAWSVEGSINGGSGIPFWIVLASHPDPGSNEIVLATLNDNKDIYAHVWNGTSWGYTQLITTSAPENKRKCFDVVYEHNRGRAFVVYADGTKIPRYYTWDGAWSGPLSTSSVPSKKIRWIKLAAESSSNRILMGVLYDKDKKTHAPKGISIQTWTGTAWSNNFEVTSNPAEKDKMVFDVAWESSSGNGMVAYGVNNQANPRFRRCLGTNCNSGVWSGEGQALNPNPTNGVPKWVRLESDPNSNSIMLMHSVKKVKVAGENIWGIGVQRWTGYAWTDPLSVETLTTDKYQSFDIVYALYNPGG
jgi:archaellum component FlaF (FlaF/FlaG flagellin family)